MRIWVVILLLLVLPQEDPYKWGRPTSKGVDKYVERNWLVFIEDYQKHVGDTLFYEPYVTSDDLSKYYNYTKGESGWFEPPDLITVDNQTRYIDYELSRLSEFRKSQYREANLFVRGVVMHELTHAYIHQIMKVVEYSDTMRLHRDFATGLRIVPQDNYFTEFIEEGICEWVSADMQEIIPYDELVLIKNHHLSPDKRNSYEVKYRYARQFVSVLIKTYGLRPAIVLIVSNPAPTREEILCPQNYYDRLSIYLHERNQENH